LFVDPSVIDDEVAAHCRDCGVEVRAYGVEEVAQWVGGVKRDWDAKVVNEGDEKQRKRRFEVFAPKTVSWALATSIGIVSPRRFPPLLYDKVA
jgi:hypothetical protein